ncbi:helix-turn-helix domain-containing protein [Micromonospora sp. SH-82]|uniref:helix-turn-helix domain-containing protein n=1 Tax=Micromonospora sp. SH-82 TaxID=3132938 RepID=UPI003EB9D6A4
MGSELPVGRRVAYWRSRRAMSQQVFADAIGKSKSWVDKVERGVRRLDKLSTLQDIAVALRIDVELLLGTDPPPAQRTGGAIDPLIGTELDPLRTVLFRYDAALARTGHTEPSRAALAARVAHAWLAFGHADYRHLLRTLPGLLSDAQLTRAAQPDDPAPCRLLGQVYQVTSAVLHKLGELATAWLTADRAMTTCRRTADPLLVASATVALVRVVSALGRPRHAWEVALAVADSLAPPDPPTADPEHLRVYGALLLQAARATARHGDRHSSADLLEHAVEIADSLGDDHQHQGTSFGPTLVTLTRVTAALDLDEHPDPLRLHRELVVDPAFQRLTLELRAGYLVDVAGGFLRRNDLPEAGRALLLADRTAPTEVRHRPAARSTLRTLLRRSSHADPALAHLAATLRIAL